jgi:hypothetical protein
MTLRRPLITLLLSLYALTVLGVIGFIAYRSVQNGGLMPRPSTRLRYDCPASPQPYAFYFRHGLDPVQIRMPGGALDGVLFEGKIVWGPAAGAGAPPGFVPPRELTYDSARSIRLLGADGAVTECTVATPR